jgi:sugar lactone lactonase YvrE
MDAAACEPGPCAPAKNYKVDRPGGITKASNGDVYFSDKLNNRLRKLVLNTATSPDQYGMTTVAGRSSNGTGEGSCATISNCQFNAPEGLSIDGADKIYIADRQNNRIRKYDISGNSLSTVAGTGTQAYNAAHDGNAATSANIDSPEGVAVEADCSSNCDIWIADKGNNRVRKVYWNSGASRYDITTTAGNGLTAYSGEGYPALSSSIQAMQGIAVTTDGVVYVADTGHDMIRKIATGASSVQYLLAATGQASGGDVNGSTAWSVALVNPAGGNFDSAGNFYFADAGDNRIRMYERSSGILRTVAGSGTTGSNNSTSALAATMTAPEGVAVYESGGTTYLYIADTGSHQIRKMTVGGTMSTYAGTGSSCSVAPCGDGGAATSAKLNSPTDVAVDASGNVYVSDTATHTIRKIDTAGTPGITNFAGTLLTSGNTTTTLSSPKGIDINTSNGDIYIADNGNNRIKKVGSAGGTMTVAAGGGVGGNCSTASLTPSTLTIAGVYDVAVTTSGTFYFVSITDYRLCKVAGSTVSSVMGTGSSGTSGDGGAPGSAAIPVVRGVSVSSTYGMWLSQYNSASMRYVSGALP